MLGKLLSSIGIGAAKVDTHLTNNRVRAGEEISGEVHIQGGNVEQTISEIYLTLFTYYYREFNDTKTQLKEIIHNLQVSDELVIKPGESKIIPFRMQIPWHTPLSIGQQKIYLRTVLDIDMAIDPDDLDPIYVMPDPVVGSILDQMEEMGFCHTYDSGKCEYSRYSSKYLPFIQEFEMKPKGMFSNQLDEVELIFHSSEQDVQVLVQIDKKAKGLKGLAEEAMGMDERPYRLTFPRNIGVAPELMQTMMRNVVGRG